MKASWHSSIAFPLIGSLAMLATAADGGSQSDAAKPVKIVQSWQGKLAASELRQLQPADGCIVDPSTWTRLWTAWRREEAVPAVDFSSHFVLVFTADGPNSVGCRPTHDGAGNVRADAMSTLIGGPGFGYLLLCIGREGVGSVNGKPVPAASVPGSRIEKPPVEQLQNIMPKANVWQTSSWDKPIVLRSARQAVEHFPAEELDKLTRQVDFARQVVLVFAWRGSGQDQLECAVAESYPEQVFFRYQPGRTRDLRTHIRVYVLRANVSWIVPKPVR